MKLSVEKNRSVFVLLDLIRDLHLEGEQDGDKIFIINDDDSTLVEHLNDNPCALTSLYV